MEAGGVAGGVGEKELVFTADEHDDGRRDAGIAAQAAVGADFGAVLGHLHRGGAPAAELVVAVPVNDVDAPAGEAQNIVVNLAEQPPQTHKAHSLWRLCFCG